MEREGHESRIGYICIFSNDNPERVFNNNILFVDDSKPNIPYLKVKIEILENESRYEQDITRPIEKKSKKRWKLNLFRKHTNTN